MRHVVFVAPYATANTLRYLEALCNLDGVTPAAISADPPERFPAGLRARLAGLERAQDISSVEHLTAAARRLAARLGPIDRILGALEQLQLPIAEVRDALQIEGMDAATTRRFRDKSAMKAALRAAEVPCARYLRATSPDDVRAFVREVGLPVIIKPVDGLGTRATHRVRTQDDLDALLPRLHLTPSQPVQVEEFLTGDEFSFETVTVQGRHVWSSSTHYIPGPLEVMETPWIQYCVVLPREEDNLALFGPTNHAALDALGIHTGLSHMEWFKRPDGRVAVNEVGARPPGVNIMPLMSLAFRTDMIQAWVRLMALDTFTPPTRQRAAGTAFLRGQGHGERVVAVHNLDPILRDLASVVAEVNPPRPGQPRASGYEGEGSVIITADTTDEIMRALARIVRNVRVELG